MIYETIYKKLNKLLPNLEDINDAIKLKADGYMDLNKELNSFLNQWLSNLLQQGHKPLPLTTRDTTSKDNSNSTRSGGLKPDFH